MSYLTRVLSCASIFAGRGGVAHWAFAAAHGLSPAVSRGRSSAVRGLLTVVASCLQSAGCRRGLHGWGTGFTCPVERGIFPDHWRADS